MHAYAQSLRRARFLMVNSSWTKNHVDAILAHHDPLLDALYLLSPLALLDFISPTAPPKTSRIVYPPCDTREMVKFPLGRRERVIVIEQVRESTGAGVQPRRLLISASRLPQIR